MVSGTVGRILRNIAWILLIRLNLITFEHSCISGTCRQGPCATSFIISALHRGLGRYSKSLTTSTMLALQFKVKSRRNYSSITGTGWTCRIAGRMGLSMSTGKVSLKSRFPSSYLLGHCMREGLCLRLNMLEWRVLVLSFSASFSNPTVPC